MWELQTIPTEDCSNTIQLHSMTLLQKIADPDPNFQLLMDSRANKPTKLKLTLKKKAGTYFENLLQFPENIYRLRQKYQWLEINKNSHEEFTLYHRGDGLLQKGCL